MLTSINFQVNVHEFRLFLHCVALCSLYRNVHCCSLTSNNWNVFAGGKYVCWNIPKAKTWIERTLLQHFRMWISLYLDFVEIAEISMCSLSNRNCFIVFLLTDDVDEPFSFHHSLIRWFDASWIKFSTNWNNVIRYKLSRMHNNDEYIQWMDVIKHYDDTNKDHTEWFLTLKYKIQNKTQFENNRKQRKIKRAHDSHVR